MRICTLTALVVVTASSYAVSLPYSTGFEASEVPAWPTGTAAASNVNWSSMNNWKMNNVIFFGGAQSLNAGATTSSLPASVVNATSLTAGQNTGQVTANTKMYMSSVFGTNATGANSVYGIATRTTWGTVGSSSLNRFVVQNNGNVHFYNNFSYGTALGNIGTPTSFQNKWLDLSVTLDTTNPLIGYTFKVVDTTNSAVLFNGTGTILSAAQTVTIDYFGLVYSSNGGSGSQVTGNVYYDDFNINVVPEPATLSILGLAAAALLRRRQK
jgi:hypothetical protein